MEQKPLSKWMKFYQLELFADFFQFYFQDDNYDDGDLSEAWTGDATNQLMSISDLVVGVGRSRHGYPGLMQNWFVLVNKDIRHFYFSDIQSF